MGDKHDNSEYQNPVSRTALQPPPPETFVNHEPDSGGDSDAAFREDIRSGMSQAEAEERAQQRAQDAEAVEPEPDAEPDAEAEPETEPDAADAEPEPGELTGDALKARAAELEIEGRSTMSAPDLRAAVAKAEAAG